MKNNVLEEIDVEQHLMIDGWTAVLVRLRIEMSGNCYTREDCKLVCD